MVTNRIACFLTCGYKEGGAMQAFLKKINNNYEYKQYLPNKTIKKKGDSKTICSKISGLTGSALLEKIYSIIKNHTTEITKSSAILIEDDLDGKFYNKTASYIESEIKSIKDKIYSIIKCDIPIFIFYASPEIESWFIADWDNGFGYIYNSSECVSDLDPAAKKFFSHHLQQYINVHILKEYSDDIENYGYFDEIYYKLSDQIIEAIQTNVKEYITLLSNINKLYCNQILCSKDLYYSKKLHGDRMLRNLEPSIVAGKCRRFFSPSYRLLANFTI